MFMGVNYPKIIFIAYEIAKQAKIQAKKFKNHICYSR